MQISKREAAERVISLLVRQDMDGYALASKTGIPAIILGEVVDVMRRQGLLRVDSTNSSADFDYRAWYQVTPAVLSAAHATRALESLASLS